MHLSFWHPVDSVRHRDTGSCHPPVSVFLGFCKSWRLVLLLLLGVPRSGCTKLRGKVYRGQRAARAPGNPWGSASRLPGANASIT